MKTLNPLRLLGLLLAVILPFSSVNAEDNSSKEIDHNLNINQKCRIRSKFQGNLTDNLI